MDNTKQMAAILERQKVVLQQRSALRLQIEDLQRREVLLAEEEKTIYTTIQGIEIGRGVQREYAESQAAQRLQDNPPGGLGGQDNAS